MKKITLLSAGLVFGSIFCIAVFALFSKNRPVSEMKMPGGESEENPALRKAWEQQMLADPVTGLIPEGISFKEQWFAASMPRGAADRSTSPWISRGPWNLGGRTRAIAIDVTNENRILAGGVSGGVWLSEDGGQSWTRKTPMNAHPGCVSIAQDTRPGKTNTWYYLSGEIYGTSASGGEAFYVGDGMFKSIDGGNTWTPIASTAGGSPQSFASFYQTGWRTITAPKDSLDVVYMATLGAIYRSANGGTNWTAVRGGNLNNYSDFTDVATTTTGTLYATLSSDGPQKGIWRSVNGTSWVNITPTVAFPATYNRFVIGINPNNENEVYFLGNTPGSGHYNNYLDSDDWSSLWKYTYLGGDGTGANGVWQDLSANLPNTGTEFDRFACQGGYDLVVKVQPGTNHVFIGGTNIYRSTDGFATPDNTVQLGGYKPGTYLPFFEIYDNHHPDQHDFLFLPSNPAVMISASDGGIHRTENSNAASVSWSSLNRGYQTTQFYTAILDKGTANDPTLIGGLQDNGNFIVNSIDPLAPWNQTVNGDGAFGAIPDGKPYYILSIQQGKVAKCAIDAAGQVTAFSRIDPIGPVKSDYQFINPLCLDPTDQQILYLPAGKAFYRQDDLNVLPLNGVWDSIATGWNKFNDLLPANGGSYSCLAVSTNNPAHRVYLGSSANVFSRIDNAHTGTPAIVTLQSPISITNGYISCIAVDPDHGDDVTLVYSNYNTYSIWRSLNGGEDWISVAGNLEANTAGTGAGPSIRWISILPFPDGSRKYFCGTSVGLYSADTLMQHGPGLPGTVWTQESPDLIGSSVVPFVDVRPSDGLVVAATHGIGMFSANFTPPSVGSNTPVSGSNLLVYPNPSSSEVNFDVQAWSSQVLDVQLFDQQGRRVQQQRWGIGEVHRLSVATLPKGVYFYEVRGRSGVQRGKIVRG